MTRPGDVLEAVIWYTGVDPRHQTVTRRVAHARSVAYVAMTTRAGLSSIEVGEFFGRDSSSIRRTTTRSHVTPAELDHVMRRVATTIATEEAHEADRALADRIEASR